MVAVASYTLPAIQVLYQLVTLGNVTNSVLALDQSPPQDQSRTLPKGYVAYPSMGIAYKVYYESVTWLEAKNLCKQKGARMVVIDSAKKVEAIRHRVFSGSVHAGIVRVTDGLPWVSVHTGSSPSSIPWKSGEPSAENGDCARFVDNGLSNFKCSGQEQYVCEIPILPVLVESVTIPANE